MTEWLQTCGDMTTATVATPTHCVFRCQASWLAIPVTAVREAIPCPAIVPIPASRGMIAGLCHVRGDFIPVLNLESVVTGGDEFAAPILLILDDTDGPWAILVHEVSSLQALEISDAPAPLDSETDCAVVGWATHHDQLIQVLDTFCLRRMAEQQLSEIQQSLPLAGWKSGAEEVLKDADSTTRELRRMS